ncbi:MAG TPA: SDR family oxidoreductase [Dehalococcoidia bacterium]|nr:SDR family oxidoreductase [Dehalococcoidia bacterium]
MSGDAVLVTGASTGLGLETSLYLAARGFEVYASMPDLAEREMVEQAASERGVRLNALALDVTDGASIEAAVKAVVERSGGVYGLVNNAGIALRGYFEDLLDEEVRRAFEVNVFGTMAVTRAVLPHMRAARRGRIVIITSVGGRIGAPAVSAYSSCKFAQEGWGESLYQEVLPFNVHVSLVAPAIIPTERWGVHRGYGQRAMDPASPYYAWFVASQRLTDKLVASSPTRPVHVAKAIHRALTAKRPKLRYLVGWRAGLFVGLRRYLPGELFERLYFGEVMRRITKAPPPAETAGQDLPARE